MPSKQRRPGWIHVRTNLAYGRKVRGHFGQKGPNFQNFVRTKKGGFGKFWPQTFIGIIRGPASMLFVLKVASSSNQYRPLADFATIRNLPAKKKLEAHLTPLDLSQTTSVDTWGYGLWEVAFGAKWQFGYLKKCSLCFHESTISNPYWLEEEAASLKQPSIQWTWKKYI